MIAGLTDWGSDKQHRGGSSNGEPASAISGHPDIPCFLLLDDPANEIFLPAGLGTDRILNSLGEN
jgi:hypothetical protein